MPYDATVLPREHLIRALEADLVGPFQPDADAGAAEEVLPIPPSRWYLTGFLAPQEGRDPQDPTSEEGLGAGLDDESEESASQDPEPKQKNRLPASLGLSVLLGPDTQSVTATVSFAEYLAESRVVEGDEGERPNQVWRRYPRPPATVELPLDERQLAHGLAVPNTSGIVLVGKLKSADAPGLRPGTRALAVFVVNRRAPGPKGREAEEFIFQVRLELACDAGFEPRPNVRDDESSEWDQRVADLQFRERVEVAVGHGTATEVAERVDGRVVRVRTAWIPRAEVPRVRTRDVDGVVTSMEALAELGDGDAVRRALGGISVAYGEWIEEKRRVDLEARSDSPSFKKGGGRGEDSFPGRADGEEVAVSRRLREKSPQPPFLKGGLRNEPRSRIESSQRIGSDSDSPSFEKGGGRGEDFSGGGRGEDFSGGGRGEDFFLGGAKDDEDSVSRRLREKSPQPPFLKGGLRVAREDTRDELLRKAERVRRRIDEGIELLASDAEVLATFRLANRAMAMAQRAQRPGREPRWHLFQLAFLLLNLPPACDGRHLERDTVELIFFPTGGGKTEAYLGVIAFTLLLRRLRGRERADAGLGVAVILRYTLRLLTLDQLRRASTLVCALEMLRRAAPERLGDVRFAIGLWVGRSATANTIAEVAKRITEYRNSSSRTASSPFPLTHCPWCGQELGKDSLTTVPHQSGAASHPAHPRGVTVGCTNFRCDFSTGRHRDGLPVLFVDEQIYRELPAFIVATVDKFAMLPWRGETGMLFGRVTSRQGRDFFGPMDAPPGEAEPLPSSLRSTGLLPPELIVQDELHLISGPLGTMVGLFETAIEQLCLRREDGGEPVRPRILASTATVRRAPQQICALFGRDLSRTALFPPPGIDDSETFFAEVDREAPGRLYVGVAAPGRAMKATLLRTYVALLCAAQKLYEAGGPADQPADGVMTLAGYFNSLRELGGMRRLVEDEVRQRASVAEERRPLDTSAHVWFANRTIQAEPVELTSREPTGRIAAAKARLGKPHRDKDHVDVLLASNMISVGVDVDRLGLMVVNGQPKTTSEYIQATSRVGRDVRWPGLVVTCFNPFKPRDRSHYERFTAYHESFYRFVEATSLTPFSGPALERGLAATLVAITRLVDPRMTPPASAMAISDHRSLGEAAVQALAERAGRQPGVAAGDYDQVVASVAGRGTKLLDEWDAMTDEMRKAAATLAYSPYDRQHGAGTPLLTTALEAQKAAARPRFVAPTSMRDVEPTVHLWVEYGKLGG